MSRIDVYTNSYQITSLPTQPYHHYDGISLLSDRPGDPPNSKRRNYEVINRLQTDRADIFNPRPVYDGRQNLFIKRVIDQQEFHVCMGRDHTRPTHLVKISRVNIVDPRRVQALTRRRAPGEDPALDTMSLNLLQLIVRQAPNLRHHFPADAKSFYVEARARNLNNGLSAWRGYYQAIRPTLDRLLINIDVSHAVVYTPNALMDTMMQYLNVRDPRGLSQLSEPDLNKLRIFLKGVYVKVTGTQMRPRPISDLVRDAGLQEFDKDGQRVTVQNHFETKYNARVRYPRCVGVRTGKTAIIPAEFCQIIGGQVYRKKIPPQSQKGFLEFATQKPEARFTDINTAIRQNVFNYTDSDFMQDAGMQVSPEPVSIGARVIPTPPIRYGGGEQMQLRPKTGSWNVVGKRFLVPERLMRWGVAVFDPRAAHESRRVQEFVGKLCSNLRNLGLGVDFLNEPPVYEAGNETNPEAVLESIRRKCVASHQATPQLILVFLPAIAPDCRRKVKHWGDITRSVSTQCVRAGKWDGNPRGVDQYCNNVALKINARLGGTNSTIRSSLQDVLNVSMIVGADVGHPGPGTNHRPSVTGLVASVNPAVSAMTSFANVQRPRQEIIADLEDMVHKALIDWKSWRQKNLNDTLPPRNIIFYRDGVSDGEFTQVEQQEIPLIKSAFDKARIPPEMRPKILFIVVGKRHHVRFFPRHRNDADNSGNCPAGLLVDQHIVNPNYDDFYLQSHSGLLGTSRPAHYVILHNDTGLSKQQVETLTFELCHTYASATRSVSIPAPVYYADKICSRLEFHVADGASLSDTASNVTGANPEFDLAQWKTMFKPTGLFRHNYFI